MADWRIYVYKLDGANGVTLVDDDVRASAQPTRELSAPGSEIGRASCRERV